MTPELVSALVASQHPDLSGRVQRLAGGWDNDIFRLGESWAVRLPRRGLAERQILHEQRWLATLAPHLPVPVPVPIRVGRPQFGYPGHWSIVPWFPGKPAWSAPAAQRARLAPGLADFVAALGRPAPPGAPRNPFRGVALGLRDQQLRAQLAGGRVARAAELTAQWEMALDAPSWAGVSVWVHGDLHPGNLLVAATGELRAVLDFGDLTAGDPATDLAAAWLCFDQPGRLRFRARLIDLAGYDDATWARARGWALVIGVAVVATVSGAGPVAKLGRHVLGELLEHRD